MTYADAVRAATRARTVDTCRNVTRRPRAAMSSRSWAMTTASAVAMITASVAGMQQAHAQAAPAPAQTAQAPQVEEIVVTGSRVISNGYEAPSPVTVMGPQQLQQINQPNIADSVAMLPAFGGDGEGSHSGGNSISTG